MSTAPASGRSEITDGIVDVTLSIYNRCTNERET